MTTVLMGHSGESVRVTEGQANAVRYIDSNPEPDVADVADVGGVCCDNCRAAFIYDLLQTGVVALAVAPDFRQD